MNLSSSARGVLAAILALTGATCATIDESKQAAGGDDPGPFHDGTPNDSTGEADPSGDDTSSGDDGGSGSDGPGGGADDDGGHGAVGSGCADLPVPCGQDARCIENATPTGAACVPIATGLNVVSGEQLSYPLAFISGSASAQARAIEVLHANGNRSWPVREGRFKALVKLNAGDNTILLHDESTRVLELKFQQPQVMTKQVRFFYFLGSDGEGKMDAPPGVDNSLTAGVARMKLAAMLLQTFFAESFKRSRERQKNVTGLPRVTFHMPLDTNFEPTIHILRHSKTQKELWDENAGGRDWGRAHSLVHSGAVPWNAKDVVHIGWSGISHREPETGTYHSGLCLGTGPLGGGGLGMCHGANLITYADSLDTLVSSLANCHPTETQYIQDDSGGRHTYGGAFAQTLGALMHEGSHGFSLPHKPTGIMSWKSGKINRFFMVYQTDKNCAEEVVDPTNETTQGADADWWHPDNVATYESSPFIY